jgi:hypothetical protein
MGRFYKDSDATLDYGFDWSDWLTESDADTISSSTWEVSPTGSLTIDSEDNTSTTTKVWLSGGIIGTKYTVTNRIVTNGGRTDDRSHKITVTSK